MWINGVVTNNNWAGGICFLTLKTTEPDPVQIQIPAALLVGFEIISGHKWAVECTDSGRPKRLINRTTKDERPIKERGR